MRRLPLLACLALPLPAVAVEPVTEQPAQTAVQPGAQTPAVPHELEQRLAESEQQRAELAAQLANPDNRQDEARIARLTQENQRLKLQLREAQANQPPRLLSEQQTWYLAGAGTALVAFLLGMLSRGRRRARREWIN
ncbi:translation initiation factor 2 (IF-2, GTPase) [Pseudomonas sp. PDNC002]|uniref:translation initiation factor 2 (IF-2, GTPase) n=1 Tax=Pseudomonas sp. PDNC002 TaxID=2811422 RepID=UPI001966B8A4|nr:translation initiation factor 2 (IF-2, GTPase) [Pseudomonas sp. PDNC002]QRY78756.1 translation initiation factor 2 (IF-2, GTPase) [Pseudomonas sp. PDNC002]